MADTSIVLLMMAVHPLPQLSGCGRWVCAGILAELAGLSQWDEEAMFLGCGSVISAGLDDVFVEHFHVIRVVPHVSEAHEGAEEASGSRIEYTRN